MKQNKILAFVLAVVMVASMFCVNVSADEAVQLYVAPDGDDSANGAFSAPLKTLTAARDAARKIDGKVIINLRGGTYYVDSTLELTSKDSNTTYRAYKDEEVIVSGAKALAVSDFKAIGDDAKAVVNQKAASKIREIDLKAAGIENFGKIKHFGQGVGHTDKGYSVALYYNDEMMTIARYPNEDYLETGSVIHEGTTRSDDGFTYTVDAGTKTRMKKWADASDMWVFGYYKHDWAESNIPVASIDAEAGTITTGWTDAYGVASQRRYYVYNLLSELDAPGEWYLDRETGKLYFYPTDDMTNTSRVELATLEVPFVKAKGVKDVLFKNIHFQKATGNAIIATDVVNFVIDSCEFSSVSDFCIIINQTDESSASTQNSGVKNSYLHDLGAGGIQINAGQRKTLTPGNCFATNNHIDGFGRIKTTYASAISLGIVGNIASHNEIHDAPHQAMSYGGNNQIIEYNEIYDVCKDTADSGAIYTGRDWSTQGHEIRYNYFHDMKLMGTKTGMKVQAVYLDDTHSSTKVHGNVFYRVSSIALYGGGRYNTFVNNLMLESDEPFRFDNRGMTWTQTWLIDDDNEPTSTYTKLRKFPYNEGVWAEQYPYLSNIFEDEPKIPKHNVIKGNVIYRTPAMELDPNVIEHGTVENNIEIANTKSFADYRNGDFTLVEGCEILEKIPDFEIVDYNKIGRYEVTDTDTDFEDGTTAVAPPAPADDGIKVLLNGEAIDFADVAPQIINDRTMVPLRAIFEALGAEVAWDDASKTVTAKKGDITIKMTIGADSFTKNDEKIALDSPATIVDSRTLVPVRAIAESFGSKVGWDGESKTVTIED